MTRRNLLIAIVLVTLIAQRALREPPGRKRQAFHNIRIQLPSDTTRL
jgi:hypothetical protein